MISIFGLHTPTHPTPHTNFFLFRHLRDIFHMPLYCSKQNCFFRQCLLTVRYGYLVITMTVLQLLHDVGVASVFKQHVVQLLHWLDLLPLAILDKLLVYFIVSFEEIIKSLKTEVSLKNNYILHFISVFIQSPTSYPSAMFQAMTPPGLTTLRSSVKAWGTIEPGNIPALHSRAS